MDLTSSPPDKPLKFASRGLAKADELREVVRELGGRAGVLGVPAKQPAGEKVPAERGVPVALRYFTLDKSRGVAKWKDLMRFHRVLGAQVPAGVKRPWKARREDGVVKRQDLHGFYRHWCAVMREVREAVG